MKLMDALAQNRAYADIAKTEESEAIKYVNRNLTSIKHQHLISVKADQRWLF